MQTSVRKWRAALFSVVLTAGLLLPVGIANATAPGINGRIVFQSDKSGASEIYTMKSDGSDVKQLTKASGNNIEPAYASDGTKITFRSDRTGSGQLWVMNLDGSDQKQLTSSSDTNILSIQGKYSPDDSKMAFATNRADGNFEIYTMNADGSDPKRLTDNPATDSSPAYSPDGTKITFYSLRDNATGGEIYTMKPDGSDVFRVTNNVQPKNQPSWSPDGKLLLFYMSDGGSANELFSIHPDGTNQTQLTSSPNGVTNQSPVFSPDGTKIVYGNNSSGKYQIYTMNADGNDQARLTNDSATEIAPNWQTLIVPPITAPDSENVPMNGSKTIAVLANDKDPYAPDSKLDPASVSIVVEPAHGHAAVNTATGEITYTAKHGYAGSDTFTYRVCESEAPTLCNAADVNITVGSLVDTGAGYIIPTVIGGIVLIAGGIWLGRRTVIKRPPAGPTTNPTPSPTGVLSTPKMTADDGHDQPPAAKG